MGSDKLKARILIYGDLHLCSKNYGSHRNYSEESLGVLREITKQVEELNVTHLIGLGDFTYGRFHTLEYRKSVEEELEKQYSLVKGNKWELRGNHDSASYGMTEYEYYAEKGLFNTAENMDLDTLHITMLNFGETDKVKPNIHLDSGHTNIILAHDFYKFKDTAIANYGKAIELERLADDWYGADYLISGHIHEYHAFSGIYASKGYGRTVGVVYPGCMSRPSYMGEDTTDKGRMVLVDISETGEAKVRLLTVDLIPVEQAFIVEEKEKQAVKVAEKQARVDISDIVTALANHEREIGDPMVMIEVMEGIPDKYKQKAIALLKQSMA